MILVTAVVMKKTIYWGGLVKLWTLHNCKTSHKDSWTLRGWRTPIIVAGRMLSSSRLSSTHQLMWCLQLATTRRWISFKCVVTWCHMSSWLHHCDLKSLSQIDGQSNPRLHGVYIEHFPITMAHFTKDGTEIVMTGYHKKAFHVLNIPSGKVTKVPGIRGNIG